MTRDPATRPARLPRPARRLLVGVAISAFGNGLVLPWLVIYLGQVRGLGTGVAGLVVAWQALVSLALGPFGGTLIDRLGPRPVLLVAPLLMAAGMAAYAFVTGVPSAFGAATLLALGNATLWSAGATMMARLSGEELRQRAFGIQFMILNLGIGVGGIVAGLLVDVHRPGTFQALYLLDALTFVAYAVVVATLRGHGGPQVLAAGEPRREGGYRDLLRDRALMRLATVSFVLLACGYGALDVGYPAFATSDVGVSPRVVAFGYVGNTVVIVLGQLLVLRLVQGRSRSRLLGLVGLVWAASWVVLGLAAQVPAAWVATVLVIASPTIFALGETVWQPVMPAIVNDLAPEHLRGRYNAVGSLTWSVAGVAGPAVAALLLGTQRPALVDRGGHRRKPRRRGGGADAAPGAHTRAGRTPTRARRRGRLSAMSDRATTLGGGLRAAIEHAGYYPELVSETVETALGGEDVASWLVHHEATFDRDELRRHVTVLVLTAEPAGRRRTPTTTRPTTPARCRTRRPRPRPCRSAGSARSWSAGRSPTRPATAPARPPARWC